MLTLNGSSDMKSTRSRPGIWETGATTDDLGRAATGKDSDLVERDLDVIADVDLDCGKDEQQDDDRGNNERAVSRSESIYLTPLGEGYVRETTT